MNEILLKEIEVADAYCESAISKAWLEACMMYTESEASDRLKDAKASVANAKAGILETIGYIIDSMITAIQEFFEMIRDKIDDIVYGISGGRADSDHGTDGKQQTV